MRTFAIYHMLFSGCYFCRYVLPPPSWPRQNTAIRQMAKWMMHCHMTSYNPSPVRPQASPSHSQRHPLSIRTHRKKSTDCTSNTITKCILIICQESHLLFVIKSVIYGFLFQHRIFDYLAEYLKLLKIYDLWFPNEIFPVQYHCSSPPKERENVCQCN